MCLSDNQEAIAEFMSDFLRLKNSLEKSPNLNRIFGEFTYAIRNGYSVRKYLEEADLLSDFETKNTLIAGFTKIKDSIFKMLEKYEDNEFRKDFNALNEAIDILKKEIKKNNNLFEQELENINSQFELILKSKNDEDYPPIFWYDIVKERAIHMERDINEKTLSEIKSEWIWMHADEYKNKYSSYSKKDIIDAMSLRVQKFGFIYKTMLNFEKKLNALAKENKISSYPYLDQFKLNISSAYASLFGTINYALSCGMTNNDISKLYSDFVYDKGTIDGTNPFVNLGTTQEDARNIIKDNLNIDIDNIKTEKVKVQQKASKENNLNKFIEELTQKLETEKYEITTSEVSGAYSTSNAFSDGGSKEKKLKKKTAKTKKNGANKEVLQSIFETKIPNKDDLKIGKKEKFIELDTPDMGWTFYYNNKLFTGTSIYFWYEDIDEEVLGGWEEGTYLEGTSHGETKTFNQDGQLTLLEIYKRHPNTKYSSVISSKEYSKNGNLIEDFFIEGQYLQLKKYYENGEKKEIKNYKKEDRVILSIVRLDGDFTLVQHKKWNEKGELIFKKEFE